MAGPVPDDKSSQRQSFTLDTTFSFPGENFGTVKCGHFKQVYDPDNGYFDTGIFYQIFLLQYERKKADLSLDRNT